MGTMFTVAFHWLLEKTPFSLFPFSTLDVRLWQSEGGEACKDSDNWGEGSSQK